jgi:DNA polymerase III psi subunit
MNSVLHDSLFPEPLYSFETPTTVVVTQPWEKIGSEEKVLLSKILGAIKLSLDSVAIKHQNKLDLSTGIKPKHVIYFGEPVNGLSFYEPLTANDVSVVLSESLDSLMTNDDAKKKLWQALKKQFAV